MLALSLQAVHAFRFISHHPIYSSPSISSLGAFSLSIARAWPHTRSFLLTSSTAVHPDGQFSTARQTMSGTGRPVLSSKTFGVRSSANVAYIELICGEGQLSPLEPRRRHQGWCCGCECGGNSRWSCKASSLYVIDARSVLARHAGSFVRERWRNRSLEGWTREGDVDRTNERAKKNPGERKREMRAGDNRSEVSTRRRRGREINMKDQLNSRNSRSGCQLPRHSG